MPPSKRKTLPAEVREAVELNLRYDDAVKRLQTLVTGNGRLMAAIRDVDSLTKAGIGEDDQPRPGALMVINDAVR